MTAASQDRSGFFWAVFAITLVYAGFLAVGQIRADGVFGAAGNDDIMRLLSVRDWLAGQSWYDMTQYSIVPPEGVSLHWSRYVDLGIGALVWVFALVLPMGLAEQVAGVAWPLLLLVALMLVVGLNTRAILGPVAGGAAVAAVVLFPPIGFNYFGTGKLDHHNVQILLMTVALFAMVRAERPGQAGVTAGVAAALSLAIGLETLFFVAAIGVIHVVQAARNVDGARARLAGFCVAIVVAALLFFAGQTAPEDWRRLQCDRLSPPYLLIAVIGAAAGLSALALPFARGRPLVFFGLIGAVVITGVLIVLPIIGACLQTPYANLPREAQDFIAARIQEALPLAAYAKIAPLDFVQHFGPAITTLILATVIYLRHRATAPGAVGQLLLFGWIGMMACVAQNRQVVLLATVIPFLIGFVAGPMLARYLETGDSRGRNAALAVLAVTVFLPMLASGLHQLWPRPASVAKPAAPAFGSGVEDRACSAPDTLARLNALPPATVLTGLNLGPRLVMVTHHRAMAAPYHRSAQAIINGFAPLGGDAAGLRAAMIAQNITYVAVCNGSTYGTPQSIGTLLANDATPAGFTAIPVDHPDLRVFALDAKA